MKLKYKVGDATNPSETPHWILNGCNDRGCWGSGFVVALSKAFGKEIGSPEHEYLRWFEEKVPRLGDIQLVTLGSKNFVVNIITQKDTGYLTAFGKTLPVAVAKPDAILEGLWRVRYAAEKVQEKHGYTPTIVSPLVGAGLGGLSWSKDVGPLYDEVFEKSDIPVVVYTLDGKIN